MFDILMCIAYTETPQREDVIVAHLINNNFNFLCVAIQNEKFYVRF